MLQMDSVYLLLYNKYRSDYGKRFISANQKVISANSISDTENQFQTICEFLPVKIEK